MGRMKEWLLEIEYLCQEIVDDVYYHGDYKNSVHFQLEVFDEIDKTTVIPHNDPTINAMIITMIKEAIAHGTRK